MIRLGWLGPEQMPAKIASLAKNRCVTRNQITLPAVYFHRRVGGHYGPVGVLA
jgi:hypothetical protein